MSPVLEELYWRGKSILNFVIAEDVLHIFFMSDLSWEMFKLKRSVSSTVALQLK